MTTLRQALLDQSPSLTLQRAAADEIARLDSILYKISTAVETLDRHDPDMRELYSLVDEATKEPTP